MKKVLVLLLASALFGCGHTQTAKVGVISFGNLEGKTLPEHIEGPLVMGKDCGHSTLLSNAARAALKGSEFDTIIDATVISETGLLVVNNCITVAGKGFKSDVLATAGGVK